ncbi:hypothetical protein NDU88_012207 [Pleurodeles waltl]|uniref:Uncharacterized protein n=1 Tax=Pleurodeles waltl TaxID=8319 RepID=A0AAV7R3Z1_PLEWA|nr:hypothetical protein NDU88_012207 [Pleurodeles waltl]
MARIVQHRTWPGALTGEGGGAHLLLTGRASSPHTAERRPGRMMFLDSSHSGRALCRLVPLKLGDIKLQINHYADEPSPGSVTHATTRNVRHAVPWGQSRRGYQSASRPIRRHETGIAAQPSGRKGRIFGRVWLCRLELLTTTYSWHQKRCRRDEAEHVAQDGPEQTIAELGATARGKKRSGHTTIPGKRFPQADCGSIGAMNGGTA